MARAKKGLKISAALKKRAAKIKVVLMDVDGTITDGSVSLLSQPDGSALELKTFDAHDGQGISLARTAGLRMGVITGRESAALRRRMQELSVEFVYERQPHKIAAYEEVLKKAGIAAAVLIPLAGKERNLGLLCFAAWSRDTIDPAELELVRTIAQYLATALDREATRTQLNRAKEELSNHAQLLEDRVQERTSRLRETLSELETFSYTIAHDLRAPARALSGFCEVLLEDFSQGMSDDAKFVVKRISRASRRMENLTADLLEFSKISRQEIVLAPVPLEPVIEEILADRSTAVRRAVSLQTPLHEVLAHRGLLRQVLSNLIDNAVKFVKPDAAPAIEISTEPVSHQGLNSPPGRLVFSAPHRSSPEGPAAQPPTPAQIRIWVRDEGIGIAAELHQKIFSIFERGVGSELY